MGDFNINYQSNSTNTNLKASIHTLGFKQIVKTSTRTTENSSTLIDLIFANTTANLTNISCFPLSFSDHDMIGCSRKINQLKYSHRIIECRDYRAYDPIVMCDELKNINWSPIEEATDVNTAVDYLNTKLTDIYDRHAPKVQKTVKGRPCKWLTRELKTEMNSRDCQLRKARRTKTENDWSRYKTLRNRCNTLIKKAKSAYHRNVLTENESNPRKFWDAIKAIYPNKPKPVGNISSNLKDINSTVIKFSNYFKSAIVTINTPKKFEIGYVSKISIERELRLLKRKKATGTDNLPPGLLKDSAKFIATPLCYIINLSIQTSTVPTVTTAPYQYYLSYQKFSRKSSTEN